MLNISKSLAIWALLNAVTSSFEIKPRYKVAMVMYDDLTMLDYFGPAEIFNSFPDTFDMHVVSQNKTTSANNGKFKFISEMTLSQATKDPKPFDMIVVPGGEAGTDRAMRNKEYLSFIQRVSKKASIVFSVCTGSLILASSGVLDGKNATTNKAVYWERTVEFPKVHWQLRARWVTDGKFVTSSGITAGIDAAYYIVSQIKGEKIAKDNAYYLEYNATWDPSNDPYVREEPRIPGYQTKGTLVSK